LSASLKAVDVSTLRSQMSHIVRGFVYHLMTDRNLRLNGRNRLVGFQRKLIFPGYSASRDSIVILN
jgi:hypothetical protein